YFVLLHHVDYCVCRFPVILTYNDFIYFTCSLIIEVLLSNICHTIEITFVVIQHSCDNFLLKLYIHWFLHFLYPSDNISPYISSAMSPKSTVFASYCPSSLKFISVIFWKKLYHVRIVRTSSMSIFQLGNTFKRSSMPSLKTSLFNIRTPPPLYFYFVLHYFHSSTYQIYCQTMSPVLGTPPSFYP